MAEELVEKVRYEADISEMTAKMRTLARHQDDLAADTDRSTGRMHNSWDRLRGLLGTGAAWFGGITAGLAVVAPKLLDSGASLEALDRKAATVFSGSSLTRVQTWAGKVAGSFGLTESQAIAMAASMGDLFKPMGFTADQAANLSTGLGDLSGALSAWTGGKRSAAEVSEILTKAMLGERDGLKELGISISEADVQARLAASGQKDLTGAALEQAKAMATMQLIQEKSTDAQTAWTGGAMDSIKAGNESKASMRQLGETMTRLVYPVLAKILPVVTKLADWLGERLPGALEKLGRFFDSVIGGGKRLIEDLANIFGTSEKTIMIVLGSIAGGLVLLAVAWNAGPGLIITGIALLVAGFLWAYENVEWFRTAVQVAFQVVKTHIDIVVGAVSWLIETFQELWRKSEPIRAWFAGAFATGIAVAVWVFDGLRQGAEWLWDKLQPVIEALKTVVQWAQDAWEWVSKVAAAPFSRAGDKAGGLGLAVGGQSKHNGGIVTGMPGAQVPAMLQVGERVLTRQQQQATGGNTTNIYNPTFVVDESPRRFFDEALWRVA